MAQSQSTQRQIVSFLLVGLLSAVTSSWVTRTNPAADRQLAAAAAQAVLQEQICSRLYARNEAGRQADPICARPQ